MGPCSLRRALTMARYTPVNAEHVYYTIFVNKMATSMSMKWGRLDTMKHRRNLFTAFVCSFRVIVSMLNLRKSVEKSCENVADFGNIESQPRPRVNRAEVENKKETGEKNKFIPRGETKMFLRRSVHKIHHPPNPQHLGCLLQGKARKLYMTP